MACPCCADYYCHAPSPCLKDIRIKVTWGGVSAVSERVTTFAGLNRGTSGTGAFETTLGICNDRTDGLIFPVRVRFQIGGSSGGGFPPAYQSPSFCERTGQRTARIYNGKVWCIVNNGPILNNYERARLYSFSFPSLDAAAVLSLDTTTTVGGTTACGNSLVSGFVDSDPTIELVIATNPPDFCDPSAAIGGFAAVSGPYRTLASCQESCGNPLP